MTGNDGGLAEDGPLVELRKLAADWTRLDAAMTTRVWVARSHDVSWTEIAEVVGLTQQQAHERWLHLDDLIRYGTETMAAGTADIGPGLSPDCREQHQHQR